MDQCLITQTDTKIQRIEGVNAGPLLAAHVAIDESTLRDSDRVSDGRSDSRHLPLFVQIYGTAEGKIDKLARVREKASSDLIPQCFILNHAGCNCEHSFIFHYLFKPGMGPDGVISPHNPGNGLIMSIWRRLGMGSSPYSPVIPLVICLPLCLLTSTWMAQGGSEAFRSPIILLPPIHLVSFVILLLSLFHTVRCHKLCYAMCLLNLSETKLGFLGADLLC